MQQNHGGNLRWAATIAGTKNILDFSANINPLGIPASALAAIQAHLQDLRHYPDPEYVLLRQALAKYHQISAEAILPGNGVSELLTWVGRDCSQLTATVLIAPAFGDYYRALKAYDAQIETFEMLISPDFEIKIPEIRVKNSHQKAILINNPHNPTGYLFTKNTLLAYLDQFALVVIDEAFMDFLPPPTQQSLIDLVQSHSNLVILRSLTKFYSLPGLRLGYAIAHPDRLQNWQNWRDPWSVNSLAAAAGIAIVEDRIFQQQTWDWLAAARPKLWSAINQLQGMRAYPGAANYLLVRSDYAGSDLQERLLKTNRILIRDCRSFAELGDRYFRVAVRLESENESLAQGLTQFIALRKG